MKNEKTIIKLLPFIMLSGCFILSFFSDMKWYSTIYFLLSQFIGASIATNLHFEYFSRRGRMCLYTYVSVIGLFVLNISDIIDFFYHFSDYKTIYTGMVSGVFLFIASIFLLGNE